MIGSCSVPEEAPRSATVRFGRFILRGGGPLFELPLIDVSSRRTALMFPPGTTLACGDEFEIVRPILAGGDCTIRPGRPREVVAAVRILAVEKGTLALVQVLRGSVIKGYWAQRSALKGALSPRDRSLNVPDFFSILHPKHQAGR